MSLWVRIHNHRHQHTHTKGVTLLIFCILYFPLNILLRVYIAISVVVVVMANFMWQLDWSWGAQIKHDSGSVWGCFWIRLAFALVNSVCPPCCESVSSDLFKVWTEQKAEGGGIPPFPTSLPGISSHLLWPSLRDLNHHLLGCSGFCTQIELHHQPSWVSSLQRADHGTSQPPLSSQPPLLHKPVPCDESFLIYKYISLLFGRKTNLDSVLKSRDITLPTKVRLVKALVFPVVMYECESWTIKNAEHQRIDVFFFV